MWLASRGLRGGAMAVGAVMGSGAAALVAQAAWARHYHGLKYVRIAPGMPPNLGSDLNWKRNLNPTPMSEEMILRDYDDVLSTFRVRPGMDNYFHSNPEYEPWYGMINEQTKDEIFALHSKDPQYWTVRKLANEYDTEMVRIEAILILKNLEKKMVDQGFEVDKEFTEKYEDMCGYPPYLSREEYWNMKRNQGSDLPSPKSWGELFKKLQPKFVYVPEEEDLGKKALFNTEPVGKRYDRVHQIVEGKVLRNDPKENHRRSKFVFLETGNRNKGQVYIREKDGKLRTATSIEREEEQRKFGVWNEEEKAFFIRQY